MLQLRLLLQYTIGLSVTCFAQHLSVSHIIIGLALSKGVKLYFLLYCPRGRPVSCKVHYLLFYLVMETQQGFIQEFLLGGGTFWNS